MSVLKQRIFQHSVTPTVIKEYIIFSSTVILLLLVLAWRLYPAELHYTVSTHMISYLGNYKLNPGWIFFSLAMCVQAMSILPLGIHLKKLIQTVQPQCSNLIQKGFSFFFIGILFMGLVGFVPDTQDGSVIHIGHIVVVIISFISLNLALGIFFIFVRQVVRSTRIQIVALVYYTAIIAMAICQIFARIHQLTLPGSGIFSFPLWEWCIFVLFYLYFFTLVASMPFDQYQVAAISEDFRAFIQVVKNEVVDLVPSRLRNLI